MIDRRRLLWGTALTACAAALPRIGRGGVGTAAPGFGEIRLAVLGHRDHPRRGARQKSRTRDLDVVEVASNQAGPVALLSDGADVIVSDWTWAMRQRSLGEKLKFSPYSSALGALVVPQDSAITDLGGLEGKSLGVAGSAIDKSWLLLRAYSHSKTIGRDMANIATPSVRRRAASLPRRSAPAASTPFSISGPMRRASPAAASARSSLIIEVS